jgi:hypothetical protein
VTLGATRDVGFGHLSHVDGGLHTSWGAGLLQEVLQGKTVHDGAEHAHVVGTISIHAALLQFGTTEEVAPANDDGHLSAPGDDLGDLLGLGVDDMRINTDPSTAENLAGKFQQNTMIRG